MTKLNIPILINHFLIMKITMALNFFLIMIIFVSFKESLQMADIKETHLKLSESRVFQIPNALLQSSKQKSM